MNAPPSSRPVPDIVEQAAHWAALMDAGDMSDADREACETWCAENPQHRVTLAQMQAFDARVEGTEGFERDALATLLAERSSMARRVGSLLLGGVILLLAGWTCIESDIVQDRFPDHQTATGEIRTIALADGSQMALDSNAAIRVALKPGQRNVRLIRGRILAEVAKDHARPFVVTTSDGTATALGTSFMVERRETDSLVTVIRSKVRVCPTNVRDQGSCVILNAGEQAAIDARSVTHPVQADASASALWATGWLEADDRPASDVLTELNRYREIPIRFDPARLRGINVTGSFPLRDIDQALDGMKRSTGLDTRRLPDGGVLVDRPR